jgi:DNA mismatch endonuclease (patch repair protein)
VTDVFSVDERSRVMSRIRSKDTLPERTVRSYLHANGFRFRLHSARLPGRPDLVLARYRLAVFVHGCFWHGHRGCKKGRHRPESNQIFWNTKIAKNVRRDQKARRGLARLGWDVVTVWECQVRNPQKLAGLFADLFEKRSALGGED